MSKVIVYKIENTLHIMRATEEILSHGFSLLQVAIKDVPKDIPFKIMDESLLPSDRAFRDAWTIDDSYLTDGVGNTSNKFE